VRGRGEKGRREQILETIRRAEPALRAFGVGGAALFGSVARGEDDEFSDVDIAVRPARGVAIAPLTLLALYGVLGDEFGHETPIDIVVLPATNLDLGAAIEREGLVAFS
jgi:predicted nucleotidyltransferase